MSAAPADVYDTDLADPAALALCELQASPWLELYQATVDMLAQRPTSPVVDLGCGTGRFPKLLQERGAFDAYHGVDFSTMAVTEAIRYAGRDGYTFDVSDLRDWQPGQVHGSTTFVCLEVFEHLDDDRDLVRRVPPGHRLIFSVPNYPSDTHTRHFLHLADVFRRYERLVDLTGWRALDLGHPARRIHLIDSTRRADSWS